MRYEDGQWSIACSFDKGMLVHPNLSKKCNTKGLRYLTLGALYVAIANDSVDLTPAEITDRFVCKKCEPTS